MLPNLLLSVTHSVRIGWVDWGAITISTTRVIWVNVHSQSVCDNSIEPGTTRPPFDRSDIEVRLNRTASLSQSWVLGCMERIDHYM